MNTYERVKEFHEVFQVRGGDVTESDLVKFRLNLIFEEFKEVLKAFGHCLHIEYDSDFNPCNIAISRLSSDYPVDKENAIKELADLSYVTAGTAITFGWNFEFAEHRVHQSNMSKLDDDGKPIFRADGKVLKGPNYWEPDMKDLV